MRWTATWRTLVVLTLAAVTVVALVSLVRSFATGRDPQTTARLTPGAVGCAGVPDDAPTGSEAAARRDARQVEQATSTVMDEDPLVTGVGVGRCGTTWVVRVLVSDLVETKALPARGTHGTPLVRTLGGPFEAS